MPEQHFKLVIYSVIISVGGGGGQKNLVIRMYSGDAWMS